MENWLLIYLSFVRAGLDNIFLEIVRLHGDKDVELTQSEL